MRKTTKGKRSPWPRLPGWISRPMVRAIYRLWEVMPRYVRAWAARTKHPQY